MKGKTTILLLLRKEVMKLFYTGKTFVPFSPISSIFTGSKTSSFSLLETPNCHGDARGGGGGDEQGPSARKAHAQTSSEYF